MTKEKFIIGGIIAIIGIIIFIFVLRKEIGEDNEEFNKMMAEYPMLMKEDSLNCNVTSIFVYTDRYDNNPYVINITMSNGKKNTIYSINCVNNSENAIQDVVKIGTKLTKSKNSDTLTIINDKGKYKFIIKDSF